IIEYEGYKKRLFVIFLGIALIATVFTATVYDWRFLLAGYVVANMFYSLSGQIYDAFLPDVTTKDRMDEVSATGYGIGYIGGSTIPFVASIIMVVTIGGTLAVRLSIILTAVWWLVFSIPIIKNVHHKHQDPLPKGLIKQAILNVFDTAKKIYRNKAIFAFIVAYFFYIDGVGTIINIATSFGTDIGLDANGMLGALFVTQIVAFPMSILYGKIANKTNPLNLITVAVITYCFVVVVGFFMAFGIEEYWFGTNVALILFFILATLVGTAQGGIQALSRSIYGRLIPEEESGDYFGFFEIFGRFAAIMGPGIYAIIINVTGRVSFSISGIIILFFVGLFILMKNRKHIVFN
ncbi:MAG: MFS transporter, partial [Defluviitaleaceae bacterium]|nr:MFS transporter [Defluviitaleaceae bacterium]